MSFYLPICFHPSLLLFLLLLIYRFSFLTRRGRSWITSNPLGMFLYMDGEGSLCACDSVCTDIRRVWRLQVWKCPTVLSLEFFQAIMLITIKQQVLGESMLKNWSFGKLVLWWIGSQWLTLWLIFCTLVCFL